MDFVNRTSGMLLDLDPDTRDRLAGLQGKVLCIELTVPIMTIFMVPTEQGVSLIGQCEQEPDVTLRGTALSFMQLGAGGLESGALSRGKITVEGDAETGQAFQRILSQMDIDWEELVSRYIGDTPARKLGNVVRGLGYWAAESAALSKKNIAEYFQEERRILATEVGMNRFQQEVEELRSDVDRIEQRLVKIERRAGGSG